MTCSGGQLQLEHDVISYPPSGGQPSMAGVHGWWSVVASGTPISGICLVYAWYIPCICRSQWSTCYIRGISLDIPCLSIRLDIHGISLNIHDISTKYIHGISMVIHCISFDVYTWLRHGIYVVYRGISKVYPSFLKPYFAAGPCCWSHSMRTRVWVIKSVLFHVPPWQLCQGKRRPTKGSTQLLPTFPACRWWRRWRQLWRRCRGRLSVFLVL